MRASSWSRRRNAVRTCSGERWCVPPTRCCSRRAAARRIAWTLWKPVACARAAQLADSRHCTIRARRSRPHSISSRKSAKCHWQEASGTARAGFSADQRESTRITRIHADLSWLRNLLALPSLSRGTNTIDGTTSCETDRLSPAQTSDITHSFPRSLISTCVGHDAMCARRLKVRCETPDALARSATRNGRSAGTEQKSSASTSAGGASSPRRDRMSRGHVPTRQLPHPHA